MRPGQTGYGWERSSGAGQPQKLATRKPHDVLLALVAFILLPSSAEDS